MIDLPLPFNWMNAVKGCNVALTMSFLVEGWTANRYVDHQTGGSRLLLASIQSPHLAATPSRKAAAPLRSAASSLTKWVLPNPPAYTVMAGHPMPLMARGT